MKRSCQADQVIFRVDLDADDGCHRRPYTGLVSKPGKIHEPDAVLVAPYKPLGHGKCDGCFADPTWSDERQKTLSRQSLHELGDDLLAPDEGRQLPRQIMLVRRRIRCRWQGSDLARHHDWTNEAISLSGACLDKPAAVPAITKYLSKGSDLEPEFFLHDVSIGPDVSQQLILAAPLAPPLKQRDEDIKGAASDAKRLAPLEQKALTGQQSEPA